jgi:hypothetical protein
VLEENADQGAIRRLADGIEQRIGHVDDVKAETIARTDEEAQVTVRLKSATGSEAVPLSVIWSNGAWKIERVP